MRKFLRWAGARAKEPTTWAGMAVIAVTLGVDVHVARNLADGLGLIIGGALVGATGMPRDAGPR